MAEAEAARNMYERSELEWLVYLAPVDYENLLLYGDVREYLRNVTEYHPFENGSHIPEGCCKRSKFIMEPRQLDSPELEKSDLEKPYEENANMHSILLALPFERHYNGNIRRNSGRRKKKCRFTQTIIIQQQR